MCKKCGKAITETCITRYSMCSECGSDLHSCINCRFYEKGLHYDCRETIDEIVTDKECANFCEYFSVFRGENTKDSSEDKAEKARSAFDALFR